MAKLYWRVKVNGKWSWKPAKVTFMDTCRTQVENLEEEE
jgi:hypothetical protein